MGVTYSHWARNCQRIKSAKLSHAHPVHIEDIDVRRAEPLEGLLNSDMHTFDAIARPGRVLLYVRSPTLRIRRVLPSSSAPVVWPHD